MLARWKIGVVSCDSRSCSISATLMRALPVVIVGKSAYIAASRDASSEQIDAIYRIVYHEVAHMWFGGLDDSDFKGAKVQ